MRVIFCGSGDFAVPSLRAISAGDHEVVAVITQPPRKAGRGRKLRGTPAAAAAKELNLSVRECQDINAAQMLTFLRGLRPDVICVADFGQFIRSAARGVAGLGAFNLHGSLLPELRGAAPVNWAVIRGHKRTGLTTFSLVDRMDAGGIYLQAEVEIDPDETADQLGARLAHIGASVVCQTLGLLAGGNTETRDQDESLATLAPRLTKADGAIDFSSDARTVRNLIHGTWPWPGGRAIVKRAEGPGVNVVIARVEATDDVPQGEPGRLNNDLMVATGRGRLRIVEIQPAGKRLMTWRDFVNGYRLSEGDHMVAPDAGV